MLTPNEENVLRRIARENMPIPRPPLPTVTKAQPSDGEVLTQLANRCEKMPVINPNTDHEVIRRVSHTMRKNETLLEWFARVGLGRAQIMQMDKDSISRFVAQAEANAVHAG